MTPTEEAIALLAYTATHHAAEVIEAVIAAGGSQADAARALGMQRKAVGNVLTRTRKAAAKAGYPDHVQHVPPGFHMAALKTQLDKDGEVKGQSVAARAGVPTEPEPLPEGLAIDRMTVQLNAAGEVERQWPKYKSGGLSPEQIIKAHTRALEKWQPPAARPVPTPGGGFEDKLAVFPWGDPHVGMLSWQPETGANYDLSIAERLLTGACGNLVEKCPPCSHALLLNLGDFFHADDQKNATPGGGNQLDVDGRQDKIIDAGIRIMASSVEIMLTKFKHVTVVNVRGNHDPQSALWLSRTMRERYRNEPRVTVDCSPAMRGYMEFGGNLLAWSHGHGPQLKKLGGIMTDEWREPAGRCAYRKWHVGHFHHKDKKEDHGVVTEVYNTMAPRDGWHATQGYNAERYSVVEIYHRNRPGPKESYMVDVAEAMEGEQ